MESSYCHVGERLLVCHSNTFLPNLCWHLYIIMNEKAIFFYKFMVNLHKSRRWSWLVPIWVVWNFIKKTLFSLLSYYLFCLVYITLFYYFETREVSILYPSSACCWRPIKLMFIWTLDMLFSKSYFWSCLISQTTNEGINGPIRWVIPSDK